MIKLNSFNQRPIGNRLLNSRRPWSKRRLFHARGPSLAWIQSSNVSEDRFGNENIFSLYERSYSNYSMRLAILAPNAGWCSKV